MALQAGIVGLPNVGKSTLFNALTAAGAESANYPFCTIEPNIGVVPVHDPRLKAVFHDMALAKTQIIQALALKVAENQEHPAEGGTVSGALRQLYADTRARLASDGDATYVAQLVSAEDRLLHAFEEALEYICGHDKVWLATGREIAQHFLDNNYDAFAKASHPVAESPL